MRLHSTVVALATAACLALTFAATALGAGPGTTFLIGGLELPPGAIPGATSGYGGDAATRTAVSDDGRYVAFVSYADVLDAAAHPDVPNVYRKDRLTGAVVLVSRASGADGATFPVASTAPAISDDGSRVAFRTTAPLDPADSDGGRADVYVREVSSGRTLLASQGDGGEQTTDDVPGESGFDLSGSGGWLVFSTSTALAGSSDSNGASDVYRRDLALGRTSLVSVRGGTARAATGMSSQPSVSDNGVWVAFVSNANDVAGATGGHTQAFARDMTAAASYLVSDQSGAGATAADGDASEPDVAGSPASATLAGVFVAYTSTATNGAPGDADGAYSVYRRQLSDANVVLVSQSTGGANASSRAHTPSISDDGARVVFSSDAGNLGAGDDYYGVYLRDVSGRATTLVSAHNAYAVQGALSGDGRFAAWYEGGGATPDSDPDLGEVFGRGTAVPAAPGAIELVSRPPGSAPFLAPAFETYIGSSGARRISADGRFVVVQSSSSHLPGTVGGRTTQVYRRDTLTGALELVSRASGADGAAGLGSSGNASISADGTRVAFESAAPNLDPSSPGTGAEAYVRDLATATTTLVSRADGPAGAVADSSSGDPHVSADGRHVAFRSEAGNLGSGARGTDHVYLRDLDGARTQLVDRASGTGGAISSSGSDDVSLSADGRWVTFGTSASLDPDDADVAHDVYVRDTVAQTTTLVSRLPGVAGAKSSSDSHHPSISADGRVVAFETDDPAVAPEAGASWGGATQVVARTLATGANALVSRVPGGAVANDDAAEPSVSGDGAVVAFRSDATNLLAGVGGGNRDAVFARSMASGTIAGPPAFGLTSGDPQGHALHPSISDDGQCIRN